MTAPLYLRPWPLAPLWAVLSARYDEPLGQKDGARLLGVTSGTLDRASKHGLTDVQADHWATRIRVHPSYVWGDAWFAAAFDTIVCARPRCTVEFVPRYVGHVTCCHSCRSTVTSSASRSRRRAEAAAQAEREAA